MDDQCSSTHGDETYDQLQSEFGTEIVRNDLGFSEDCTWEFQPPNDNLNFLVANFTNVSMNCDNEFFEISDAAYCGEETFCLSFPGAQCNDGNPIPGCNYVNKEVNKSAILRVVTNTKNHGFDLRYQFFNCREFLRTLQTASSAAFTTSSSGTSIVANGRNANNEGQPTNERQDHNSGNVVGILVPIMLLIGILTFISCLYLFLKYRGKKRRVKQPEPVSIQQYISTVGADNYVMASDMAPGSNFTLQFARSYESVPRGTSEDPIPLYSVIQDVPDNKTSGEAEDRNYDVIGPVKQDVRRLKKSSDTSSISNISLSQEKSSKSNGRPLYAVPWKKQKLRTQKDSLSGGEMTQSLGDLTNLTRLDHRKFSLEQPCQFSSDVIDVTPNSKSMAQQSIPLETEPSTSHQKEFLRNWNSKSRDNFGFIDDGDFDFNDY